MHIDFCKNWLSTYRVINVFWKSTNLWTFFYLAFYDIISTLWTNEIDPQYISKVVQKALKYLHINFCKNWLNTYRVINIF